MEVSDVFRPTHPDLFILAEWETEFERMGENNVPAYVLSATVKGGMPLLYS